MPTVQLAHPPRTRDELWWAVWAMFGVCIPRVRVCPDHCAPFDAFADAYFRECTIGEGEPYEISRAIWHASRGLAGKSKTLSILGLTLGYIEGADITILGGSMAQSVNVHEYMVKGMEAPGLPREMLLDQTATRISLSNAGRVRPLPASQRNVRGPHPSVLLMDEVDEMELEIYDAALGQPMPQNNYLGAQVQTMTVVSSTWQNASGTLTEIFRRAEEQEPINDQGDRKTPIYRWCYKENHVDNNPYVPMVSPSGVRVLMPTGWLGEKTIQEKKDSVSVEMFRIEYDLGEPSIGNRAIDTELLDKAWCLSPEDEYGKVVWENHSKDWDEWRFQNPVKGATYVSGTDWAKETDKTVITIARTDTGKRHIVYTARINRQNYSRMVGLLNTEQGRYGMDMNGSWHDSTGLGNVINDLTDDNTRPFSMTGDKRTNLLSEYVVAIEKQTWEFPKALRAYYTEHKLCSTGDLYNSGTSQKFHLPDTICSLALAEHGAKRVVKMGAPGVIQGDGSMSHDEKLFANLEGEPSQTSANPLVRGSAPVSSINLIA